MTEYVCPCPLVGSLFTGEPTIFHKADCPARLPTQPLRVGMEFLSLLDVVNAEEGIETKDGFELGGSH
mgnify:CR=1 FL=1